ncbi:M23 family metallopeptidase [Sphingomonas crusticola]|uniref:M23 family metallopeptidase n=1 Tax=Sphingomonas crusticola TaxID=1697973 RepID=UPI000E267981|nr:M23 family metallopeptidase [Sphingomonas crusticola]
MKGLAVALPLLLLGAAAPVSPPPRLAFPVACSLGTTCAIQSYRDDDPGPAVRDYACHGRTYQAHDGTDIRLPSMMAQRRGVNVLAAAPGTVLRSRDGLADRSIRDASAGAVAGQECGNGLVVDHGGGWETQYCHMARGSIVVRPGDAVRAGTVLGKVGLSGDTEFPHLHLSVRHDSKSIDPFAWGAPANACQGGRSLWAATPPYREGEILVSGFAGAPVTMGQVQDAGSELAPRPTRKSPLVAFVQSIGLQAGDVQRLILQGPDGAVLADNRAPALERDKAQVLLFAGRKAQAGGWKAGIYRAAYSVTRRGKIVIARTWEITL